MQATGQSYCTQVDDDARGAYDEDDDDEPDARPAAAAADITATTEADTKKSVRLAAGLDGGWMCGHKPGFRFTAEAVLPPPPFPSAQSLQALQFQVNVCIC